MKMIWYHNMMSYDTFFSTHLNIKLTKDMSC